MWVCSSGSVDIAQEPHWLIYSIQNVFCASRHGWESSSSSFMSTNIHIVFLHACVHLHSLPCMRAALHQCTSSNDGEKVVSFSRITRVLWKMKYEHFVWCEHFVHVQGVQMAIVGQTPKANGPTIFTILCLNLCKHNCNAVTKFYAFVFTWMHLLSSFIPYKYVFSKVSLYTYKSVSACIHIYIYTHTYIHT